MNNSIVVQFDGVGSELQNCQCTRNMYIEERGSWLTGKQELSTAWWYGGPDFLFWMTVFII